MGVEIHMPVIKFHSRAIETPTFIVSKDSIVKVADTIILTRILKARVKCFTSATSVWLGAGACKGWKAITYSWYTSTSVQAWIANFAQIDINFTQRTSVQW